MSYPTREQIMAALFAYLQAGCGATFATYSRRFLMWEKVATALQQTPPLAMPALYLYDGMGLGGGLDHFEPRGRASPGVEIMHRTIVIYATLPNGASPQGQDGTTAGGAVFNPLIDSIRDCLAVPDSQSQNALTLGGLVSHCWLEGDAMMMTGELDDVRGQGMLTLPVKIMLYPKSQ